MDKKLKISLIVGLLLILIFSVLQATALQGRQSQGYSQKYINTYTILGSVSALILIILFLISFIPSDSGIVQIFSLAEFDDEQDFRIDWRIMAVIAVVFFAMITYTSATGLVQWQPSPVVFNLDESVKSPMSAGHDDALTQMGVSKVEESWFSSFQPAFQEDTFFNFILPLIMTGLILLIPLSAGRDLDSGSFFAASLVACLITSGITGAYNSGLVPTFAGAHTDVYSSSPDFYAAAFYSFIASFINVQMGFPVTIPAHFTNNWFVSQGMMIGLAIGISKGGIILGLVNNRRFLRWKQKNILSI